MELLTQRTKAFAVRVIRLYDALPSRGISRVLGGQFVRSATSVGAHTREAFRSRSDAEWVSKMQVALQELDETLYWLELLVESEVVRASRLEPLMQEVNELAAIIVTSIKTVKQRRKQK